MLTVKKLIEPLKADAFVPSECIFPSLESHSIAAEMRLLERAQERGKENLPPSDLDSPRDLDTLDPVESEIIAEVGRLRLIGIGRYEEQVEAYARRLREASTSKAQLATVAGKAVTDYETRVAIHRDALSNVRLRVIERCSERKLFIADNRLRRTAHDQKSMLLFLSMVMLLILVESAVNGYFFAAKNALGLLGGASVAFVISMVNVGFSLVASFFFRNINHVRIGRRAIGLLVLSTYLPFILFFNVAVVHFRDATVSNSWEVAVNTAIETLFGNPLSLQSFESWLLFFVSMLICILAFWKGYSQTDPYPDYSRVHHRWEDARDDYAARVEEARMELEELRNEAVSELEEARRMLASSIREASDILYIRSELSGHLERFLEQSELLANHLLMLYREANQSARTKPSPSHFKRYYSFANISLGLARFEANQNHASAEIDFINKVVDETIEQIFKSYSEAVHSYESIEDLELIAGEHRYFD